MEDRKLDLGWVDRLVKGTRSGTVGRCDSASAVTHARSLARDFPVVSLAYVSGLQRAAPAHRTIDAEVEGNRAGWLELARCLSLSARRRRTWPVRSAALPLHEGLVVAADRVEAGVALAHMTGSGNKAHSLMSALSKVLKKNDPVRYLEAQMASLRQSVSSCYRFFPFFFPFFHLHQFVLASVF